MYALTWLPQQELNCVSIIILLYQEYAYESNYVVSLMGPATTVDSFW